MERGAFFVIYPMRDLDLSSEESMSLCVTQTVTHSPPYTPCTHEHAYDCPVYETIHVYVSLVTDYALRHDFPPLGRTASVFVHIPTKINANVNYLG